MFELLFPDEYQRDTILYLLMVHLFVTPWLCAQLMRICSKPWWIGAIVGALVPYLGPLVLGIWALVTSFIRLGNELEVRPAKGAFEGRSDLAFNTLASALALIGPFVLAVPIILTRWLPWQTAGGMASKLEGSDAKVLVGGGLLLIAFAVITALTKAPRWSNVFTFSAVQISHIITLYYLRVSMSESSTPNTGTAEPAVGLWIVLIVTSVVNVGCILYMLFVKSPTDKDEHLDAVAQDNVQPNYVTPGNVPVGAGVGSSLAAGYGSGPGAPGTYGPGPGMQGSGMQSPGAPGAYGPGPGMQSPGMQNPGMQNPGAPGAYGPGPGMQGPGMQSPGGPAPGQGSGAPGPG